MLQLEMSYWGGRRERLAHRFATQREVFDLLATMDLEAEGVMQIGLRQLRADGSCRSLWLMAVSRRPALAN